MQNDLLAAVEVVLQEVLQGASSTGGWVLNSGDRGLLRSLEALSAEEASRTGPAGGASAAAHADHLRYGLSLLNQVAPGVNPFAGADWTRSWKRTAVSEREWKQLLSELRSEAEGWSTRSPEMLLRGGPEATGTIAAVAHLAYHLGAIRQIAAGAKGPSAEDGR
jgi:hypothetical protein